MKIFRFHPQNTFGHLLLPFAKRFLFILAYISLPFHPLHAQTGCDFVGLGSSVVCSKATAILVGNEELPANYWDFGDGTPILSGGPELYLVEHDYFPNLNPFATPLPVIKHSQDGINWCIKNLNQFLPSILVGSGAEAKTLSAT